MLNLCWQFGGIIGRKNKVKMTVALGEMGRHFYNFKTVCAGLNTFPVLFIIAFVINMQ